MWPNKEIQNKVYCTGNCQNDTLSAQAYEKKVLENLDILTKKPQVINVEENFWEAIKQAAAESNWIPKEYYMNDWVSDVCKFLREGERNVSIK